jgi:hypothetical protein
LTVYSEAGIVAEVSFIKSKSWRESMSVTDPLKFIIALIVIGMLFQMFGIVEGPFNPTLIE